MKASEAARHLGISPRRVRQLIEDNMVAARRLEDGVWDIDPRSLIRGRHVSRPLSERSANAVLAILDGKRPVDVSASEASRLRAKIRSLKDNPEAAAKVMSWLANRSVEYRLAVNHDSLEKLRRDPRIKLSGVSHPESDMFSLGLVEGYISEDDFDSVVDDYGMVPQGFDNNVVLRIREVGEVSLPLVMVDLLEGLDARARGRGMELLEGMLK